ncbi:Protein kinase domain-containing protein [Lentzea albidocapillata subsp. violacea]|uniref:Protein kinase domain-containing protein n=1 Tax=Lentzea albidocapillata subsp. violacea TaxID=128104 RepID=A0A1G9XU46_9PSEU|nr:protein kinase family protein [Lentzea albidocapillata]SDN00349.1 Protein kinase domain-containing protein [Lentzea albidocapillata subsp. violacea]
MSSVDLNLPAALFTRFLAGCGLEVRRTIAFAGLSTLAVVNGPSGAETVAKGLSGYYHVIDAAEPEQAPGVYGYYWYKRFGPEQHELWRKAFAFEFDVLRKLRGADCVAEFVDGDLDAEIPYYLMRYYPRGSLAAAGASCSWDFSSDFVVRSVRDIAEGLASLHGAGVAHRDLNAENVLLKDEAGAVIADLGCARALDAEPTGPHRKADEFHWPPEYADAYDRAGVEADLYSLGVLIHQMTVGRMPRHGGPGCAVGAPTGKFPPVLTALGDACLEYQPHNRPESTHAVLSALATA